MLTLLATGGCNIFLSDSRLTYFDSRNNQRPTVALPIVGLVVALILIGASVAFVFMRDSPKIGRLNKEYASFEDPEGNPDKHYQVVNRRILFRNHMPI